MSIFGNIIWLIFGGFLAGLGYILGGLALCITIGATSLGEGFENPTQVHFAFVAAELEGAVGPAEKMLQHIGCAVQFVVATLFPSARPCFVHQTLVSSWTGASIGAATGSRQLPSKNPKSR
jgi:hypothetical protein